jgi:uncharacterized protein with HEPN domain
VSPGDVRPDRHALLELDALLGHVVARVEAGSRERFDADDEYRWVLHRLWIAIGNEAAAYAGADVRKQQPWAALYRLRNHLAHSRLPDIDEDLVWRTSQLRPTEIRAVVRSLLH